MVVSVLILYYSTMKIITRADAIAHGLAKYFTGKPCKRGHISARWTNTSNCADCTIERIYAQRMKIKQIREMRDRESKPIDQGTE